MNIWKITFRFSVALFVALLLVVVVSAFTPKVLSLREMQARKSELEEENKRLDREINELRLNQERFNTDPAFVEWIAKKDLGMVKTNEVVFKFIPAIETSSDGLSNENKKH